MNTEDKDRAEFTRYWQQEGTFCDNPFTGKNETAYRAWQAAKESSRKEVERLNALLAMQAEALESMRHYCLTDKANAAIKASSETVAAWTKYRDAHVLEGAAVICEHQIDIWAKRNKFRPNELADMADTELQSAADAIRASIKVE